MPTEYRFTVVDIWRKLARRPQRCKKIDKTGIANLVQLKIYHTTVHEIHVFS